MHGGSRQVDLLDPIIDKEISHQADSSESDGLSAEDKEEISNLYMEVKFFLQIGDSVVFFFACGLVYFIFSHFLIA